MLTPTQAYHIRRLQGDIVTTSTATGLHRLPNYSGCEVTAASEFKRQIFCCVYNSDKTHASLNGTPPLLTRAFCDPQPPLDLPAGAVFLPRDELAKVISELDPEGWHTSADTYHNSTVLRAKFKLALIREEILELALGVNTDSSLSRIWLAPVLYALRLQNRNAY